MMGQHPLAVVDDQLGVRGLQELPVIDAIHHAGGNIDQHEHTQHRYRRKRRGHDQSGRVGATGGLTGVTRRM